MTLPRALRSPLKAGRQILIRVGRLSYSSCSLDVSKSSRPCRVREFASYPRFVDGQTRASSTSTPLSSISTPIVVGERDVVDFRSDTVTSPTRPMLECALHARTGDDVFGEDPTVLEVEEYAADLFGKEKALFLPTGTMANLVAILSHCHGRASEMIVGSGSHICLYEGGNAANMGGVHPRQIPEDEETATLPLEAIRDAYRRDDDDHYAETSLICIENTHNLMGGVAVTKRYIDDLGRLARDELGVSVHIDGARIFNSAVAQKLPVSELCKGADSIAFCMSKGLGAPLGSILVGEEEFIRLAKRARKRCGGGMRQAGVVASMGMYALANRIERLAEDHSRARRLAAELREHGFWQPRNGKVDTNIVYFGMPENALVSAGELETQLWDKYGVKIAGGYTRKGFKGPEVFRVVTHSDIDDEGIDRALDGIVKICLG